MLEELRRDVLVSGSRPGEFERHAQHGGAIKGHPGGAVCLLQLASARQRVRAIEEADVIEAEESATEDILSTRILAIDPPSEVQEELLKATLEEQHVAF